MHFNKKTLSTICFAAMSLSGCVQNHSGLEPREETTRKDFFCYKNTGKEIITEIYFVTPEIVRVIKTPVGQTKKPLATPSVILKDTHIIPQKEEHDKKIILSSEKLRVEFDKDTESISFSKPDGTSLMREAEGDSCKFEEAVYGSGKTLKVMGKFRVDADEDIYGFGQPQNGKLSQRGSDFQIMQGYRFVSIPMFQSIKGYGVFIDNPSIGHYTDKNNILNFSFQDAENFDYYFMYGGSTDGTVELVRKLTGDAPMHPLWTLGFWQSRERYKTQEELLEVLRKYRELHIPLDGMIQDWQYWGENNDNWNAMQFLNPGFQEPAKMFQEVHDRHAHAMLVIWPDFGQNTEQYKVFDERKMLLPITSWPNDGKAHPYDPYNAEARDIYWSYASKLLPYGVDAWWMDSTEPDHHDIKETDYDLPTGMGSFRRVRNLYPFMTTGGVYEKMRQDNPDGKRVFILTRCAYIGQQRFGTNTWSGDTETGWDSFKDQVACGINMGLVGLPYWNADIGGFFLWHYPRRTKELSFHELYARWMQFGAFTPMMRSHGTDGARELYYYGKEGDPVYDAMVRAIHTRYALIPYIYSMMHDVNANRASMMRPLFADFAQDKATHRLETEYMFGKSLLVAPVFQSQYLKANKIDVSEIKSSNVYLPNGSYFYDFHTGKKYSGGRTIQRETPLDLIPVYVKEGSILPIAEPVEYAEEKPWDNLEIRIYRGADGEFTLYEDEFDNYNYEKGVCTTIKFQWNDADNTLTIGKREGKSFPGMLTKRNFNVVLVEDGVGISEKLTQKNVKKLEYVGKELKVKF